MQDNWSDAQLHAILAEVCFAQDKLEKYIKSSQNKVITNPKLEPTETNIEGKNFNLEKKSLNVNELIFGLEKYVHLSFNCSLGA